MVGKRTTRPATPEICPVCGQEVPARAVACPECGADHHSGWRENAESYDALDSAEDDFDYDHFVAQEFGSSPKPAGVKVLWWITAIVVIVILLVIYLKAA